MNTGSGDEAPSGAEDRLTHRPDRRAFLRSIGPVGTILLFWPEGALAQLGPSTTGLQVEFDYKYRTVSIEHLREMKEMIEKLNRAGKLCKYKTFQGYIKDFEYQAPKAMPNARSLIIIATPWKLRSFTFRLSGRNYLILVPGGYFLYDHAPYIEALARRIARDVLREPNAKLVFANPPLKAMAVRSGLAEYGRNNIAYVDEYGSFHALWAFFTERVLPDQWERPFRMMRFCKGCSICMRACTTKAISESNFRLDAGRCITLYNETKDPIPDFIDPKVHNALIGCLKCQYTCPANLELIHSVDQCASITEEETRLLISGKRDPKLEASISAKLQALGSSYAQDIPYLSRNLKMALANVAPPEALA